MTRETNVSGHFTHVYHIADIHIRRESGRAAEFAHVLSNLVELLASREPVRRNRCFMVLAGDIFDDKDTLTQHSAEQFAKMMRDLTQLMPVVVIPGNHDFRQTNPTRPDRIETMLHMLTMFGSSRFPIVYCSDTGIYTVGNVYICTVSAYDSLSRESSAGNVDVLPDFPQPPHCSTSQYAIAVAHSTVKQTDLIDGLHAGGEFGCTLAWFGKHTMVMLGDEHVKKKWKLPSGGVASQPGSIMTHSFGEPTLGHACLEWNLDSASVTDMEIPNQYARISLCRGLDGDVRVRMQGSRSTASIPASEALRFAGFPSRPRCRLMDDISEAEAREALGDTIDPFSFVTNRTAAAASRVSKDRHGDPASDADIVRSFGHSDKIVEWVRQRAGCDAKADGIASILHDPRRGMCIPRPSVLPDRTLQSIDRRNASIAKHLDLYERNLHGRQRRETVVLIELHADWIGRYERLRVDFSKLPATNLVDGPNNAGKSTFIDCILVALYGRTADTREEYKDGTATSCSFVNVDTPRGSAAQTKIVVSLGGETFTIERKFHRDRDGFKQTSKSSGPASGRFPRVTPREETGGEPVYMIGKVGDWVDARIGSVHDVCMGSILSQSNASSFFKCDAKARKEILERHTGLFALHHLEDAIGEFRHGLKDLCKHLTALTDGLRDDQPPLVEESEVVNMRQELDRSTHRKRDVAERARHKLLSVTSLSHAESAHLRSPKCEREAQKMLEHSEGRLRAMMTLEGPDNTGDLESLEVVHQHVRERMAALRATRPRCQGERKREAAKNLRQAEELVRRHPLVGDEETTRTHMNEETSAVQRARHPDTSIPKPAVDRPPDEPIDEDAVVPSLESIDGMRHRKLPAPLDQSLYQAWTRRHQDWMELVKRVGKSTVASVTKQLRNWEKMADLLVKEDAAMREMEDLALLKFNRKCLCCLANLKHLKLDGRTRALAAIQEDLRKCSRPDGITASEAREQVQTTRDFLADTAAVASRWHDMDRENRYWSDAVKNDAENKEHCKRLSRGWWAAYDDQERRVVAAQSRSDDLRAALDAHSTMQTATAEFEEASDAAAVSACDSFGWLVAMAEMSSRERILRKELEALRSRRTHRQRAVDDAREARDTVAYLSYLDLSAEEAKVDALLLQQQSDLARLQCAHEAYSNHQERARILSDATGKAVERLESAELLKGLFCCEKSGGYAWHVYREVVLPRVASAMNKFLEKCASYTMAVEGGDITACRQTKQASLSDASTGVNRIGGADKFVLELAARCALQRFGTPGFNWTQIFVDEGFTHFDASRRADIETVVVSLIESGKFHQVILTSHLQAVRAVCERTLTIRVGSRSSVLSEEARIDAVNEDAYN